ncbi:DUF2712 domain-containing protein [Alkalihalobacillus sp. LMS39]|uniref:DUF2712 domain-containing protein n=1 Tax=Alkalihalobacillus sp. LMS39 TaxID=2924032 RepID=UPI001FB5039E|nr:DUF2712 domain-containing protein [Alkalihalobacillus sp. LMS39]UOE94414.1 DUF2712 domain-containing protein [Alkalihalobacillus sp. LMS39]
MKLTAALVLGVTLIGAANATFASDDKHGYSFTIKPKHENNYSGERYRQTQNTNNKWKVALETSGEGKGTITTFWLDKADTGRVSNTVDAKQGAGAYYREAFSAANQSYVRLGAENNNYSTKGYTATGYWDEETN